MLSDYRRLSHSCALLKAIPAKGLPYLYDLVASYPRRSGKGLRAALCFATCAALGGRPPSSALNLRRSPLSYSTTLS